MRGSRHRPDHVVLYDGDCGLCMRLLGKIMAWDKRERLEAEAIQSDRGQELLADIPADERLDSWHLVDPEGNVTSAGAAVPPLFRLLPGGRLIAIPAALVPAITEAVYRWVAANRDILGRFLVVLMAFVMVGCGSTVQAGSELTVHVSVPLQGPDRGDGRATLAGAELALEQAGGEAAGAPVRLVAASSSATGEGEGEEWTQATIAANARGAAEDSASIAYIGELGSTATLASAPITNDAGIPQVSPAPISEDLLTAPGSNDPPDEVQPSGERTLFALRDRTDPDPEPTPALAGFGAEFEAANGAEPPLAAAYGYEAMALLLDAIERAGDPLDRDSVRQALLDTANRDSILGTYSIGSNGLATLP